jgi:hypothetical protein
MHEQHQMQTRRKRPRVKRRRGCARQRGIQNRQEFSRVMAVTPSKSTALRRWRIS